MKRRIPGNENIIDYIIKPMFHMTGKGELIAEGVINIEKYQQTDISLTVCGMKERLIVEIKGDSLYICFYNSRCAKISGKIDEIKLLDI